MRRWTECEDHQQYGSSWNEQKKKQNRQICEDLPRTYVCIPVCAYDRVVPLDTYIHMVEYEFSWFLPNKNSIYGKRASYLSSETRDLLGRLL